MGKQKPDIIKCSDTNETHIFRKPEKFANFEEKKIYFFSFLDHLVGVNVKIVSKFLENFFFIFFCLSRFF